MEIPKLPERLTSVAQLLREHPDLREQQVNNSIDRWMDLEMGDHTGPQFEFFIDEDGEDVQGWREDKDVDLWVEVLYVRVAVPTDPREAFHLGIELWEAFFPTELSSRAHEEGEAVLWFSIYWD